MEGPGMPGAARDPLPFPPIELEAADYQRLTFSCRGHEFQRRAIVSPRTGLAYMYMRDINPSPQQNGKAVYLCRELMHRNGGGGNGDGGAGWVATHRSEVVIKASRLDTKRVAQCMHAGPTREKGDEPLEEAKAMSYLSRCMGPKSGTVPLLDCFIDGEGWLYLVLPYFRGGDLVNVVEGQRQRRPGPEWVRRVFTSLLETLQGMKRMCVAHMDLSPENCFLDHSGAVCVGDLGMCLFVGMPPPSTSSSSSSSSSSSRASSPTSSFSSEDESEQQQPHTCHPTNNNPLPTPPIHLSSQTFRGKAAYHAPEVVREEAFDPFAADVFSLGCTLYTLLTGRLLLEPSQPNAHRPRYDTLIAGHVHVLLAGRAVPPVAADLIARMVHPDAARRISLEQAIRHPYVVGGGGECQTVEVGKALG